MFSRNHTSNLVKVSSQIRHASNKASRNQTSSMRSSLARFLGPRNYKGFHKSNPFFFPPSNHSPNYISQYPIYPSSMEGRKIHWNKVFENGSSGQSFKSGVTPFTPFATNTNTKTNMVVSQRMKDDIMRDINENKRSAQDVSYQYGLSVPRVEAIVELETIRKKWSDEKKITNDLKRMARVMEGMIPQVRYNRSFDNDAKSTDDLSEIPVLEETRSQRFVTIAESEPFGPLDAAKTLGIESASTMLEKLKSTDDHHQLGRTASKEKYFIGKQLENEKALFKFIPAKVGEIGYRYGAARDDQKHNRKVKYNNIGQKQYLYQ